MRHRECVAAVRPVAACLERLTVTESITVLMAVLTQQVCLLPPGEREAQMGEIVRSLPGVFEATQAGMRAALAANARDADA